MEQVIIVGSGLSGIAAALELVVNNIKPVIVDVGFRPSNSYDINENFYSYRKKENIFDLVIGNDYSGLHHILYDRNYNYKLKSPLFKYVTKGVPFSEVVTSNGNVYNSYASGGLANAWGAGVYEYDNSDLKDFPFMQMDLTPYYKRLYAEIGVSGVNDDLTSIYGHCENLLPHINLSEKCSEVLSKYQKKRRYLNRHGFILGRSRIGVLSESYQDRNALKYHNLEFWQPNLEYIYNPKFTLQKLIKDGLVEYRNKIYVESYFDDQEGVSVFCRHIESEEKFHLKCIRLMLACGPVETAKLVLASNSDFETKLNFIDNPAVQIPVLNVKYIGKKLETSSFGLTQLNFGLRVESQLLHGSILETTSPLRSEFIMSLPFSLRFNLKVQKYLMPAMLVCQVFAEGTAQNAGKIYLRKSNQVCIDSPTIDQQFPHLDRILKYLSKLDLVVSKIMVKKVSFGNSIHYGGVFPMKEKPLSRYECDRYGKINSGENVYIIDSSTFPSVPSKNHGFTLMANSMRIANHVARKINENGFNNRV